MNMKMIYERTALILSAAILSICAIAPGALFGQDVASAKQPVLVDLAQNGDSPLRLTRTPSVSTAAFGVRVENVGQAPIVSYVIVAQGARAKTDGSLSSVLNDWLLPGSSLSQSLPVDGNVTAYTVDYVRFAGGSSWGSDSAHMSTTIDATLAGRQAAIDRLRELVSLQDHDALLRILNTEPAEIDVAVDASHSERWQLDYRSGYRSLISWVARFRDQGEEAILARLSSIQ